MARIEIQRLTKMFYPARTFGAWWRAPWRRSQAVTALEAVSLTIEPGDLVCVMGSNGAGKTTLLKILAGLILPTSGSVRIGSVDVCRAGLRLRSQIGFASSDRPGFYDRLTGRQNLEFFAALFGLPAPRARRRIEELVELLELEARDRSYQEYSAGMKQRLLLARALLHDPAILLLDEPTKSLDPVQTLKVQTLIKEQLHRTLRKTILFTSHRADEAEHLAGRVAILHRGVLKAYGTLEDVTQGHELDTVVRRLCREP